MSTIFKRVSESGRNQYHAAIVSNGVRRRRIFYSRTSAVSWVHYMEHQLQKIRMGVEFNEHT